MRHLDPARTVVTCHDLILLVLASGRMGSAFAPPLATRDPPFGRGGHDEGAPDRDRFRIDAPRPALPHLGRSGTRRGHPPGAQPPVRAGSERGAAFRTEHRLGPGPLVLQVGQTGFYKNLPGCLRVLARLRKDGLPVTLVRAGHPLRPEHRELAARLGVAEDVRDLGPVADHRACRPLQRRRRPPLPFPLRGLRLAAHRGHGVGPAGRLLPRRLPGRGGRRRRTDRRAGGRGWPGQPRRRRPDGPGPRCLASRPGSRTRQGSSTGTAPPSSSSGSTARSSRADMCGIAGIVRFDGSPVDPAVLRAMVDSMTHRGPDDSGCHVERQRRAGNAAALDPRPVAHRPPAHGRPGPRREPGVQRRDLQLPRPPVPPRRQGVRLRRDIGQRGAAARIPRVRRREGSWSGSRGCSPSPFSIGRRNGCSLPGIGSG